MSINRKAKKKNHKTSTKVFKIPQLDRQERIELQNIMLRLALEGERIKNLENDIKMARGEMIKQEGNLRLWKGKFDAKLRQCGLTIEQVDINAENGKVMVLSIPKTIGK